MERSDTAGSQLLRLQQQDLGRPAAVWVFGWWMLWWPLASFSPVLSPPPHGNSWSSVVGTVAPLHPVVKRETKNIYRNCIYELSHELIIFFLKKPLTFFRKECCVNPDPAPQGGREPHGWAGWLRARLRPWVCLSVCGSLALAWSSTMCRRGASHSGPASLSAL